jgi:hypothetical protein
VTLTGSRRGEQLARLSLWVLVGVPAGVVLLAVWAVYVKTSPTLSDAERVRGWGTVVRELPATLFLFGVVFVGFVLAVRAGQLGSKTTALRALWLHAAALFFILAIVFGGSAENIMTTRPATVKWLLFPLEVAIVVVCVAFSRRMITHRETVPRS